MSLRVMIDTDQIEKWINARNGQPARRTGSDTAVQILFNTDRTGYDTLSCDDLFETMKQHHLVLMVDEEAGNPFHQFVVRG